MKLILVMVTSLDGRSTCGDREGTHEWNSEEDKKHFQDVIKDARLLIMGSSTYEGARSTMEHTTGRKRIIITRDPSKYESYKIPGQLEFTNEKAADLINRLSKEGNEEAYLLGGAHTNTEFLKQNLVDEFWQTLEPKILGLGNGIVGEEMINVNLQLISSEKINETGTLLLKYKILK